MKQKLIKQACYIATCLILLLGMTAFQFVQSAMNYTPIDATWTGATSRGHPMSFNVSSAGTEWNTFKLKTDFNATNCGATGTIEITVPGPGSITNDQFSYTSSTYSFTGQFNSISTASGTYSFVNRQIVVGLPYPPYVCYYYLTQSGTWSASTPLPPPGDFSKSGPTNGATGQSLNLTLAWNPSAYADNYQYCIDQVDNSDCDTSWEPNPATSDTSIGLTGLASGTTYYWQVRAINSTSTTIADGNTWWSFATGHPPGSFGKVGPSDMAINQPTNPTLSWSESTGATSYEYCIDKTDDDNCSSWIDNGTATTKTLSGLTNNTTYFWHVRAINAIGDIYSESSNTAFWSFTTRPQLTLRSTGTQDGWTLESGENTNVGGTMNNVSTSMRIGDDAARKQYRSILSFNTSGLPDNAILTKVTLKVRQQNVTIGENPINALQGFMVDIRKGTFGASALQLTDWQATASKTVGPFYPPILNNWYTFDLTSAKAYINKLTTASGLTQIRLRFQLDDNNDSIANFLSIFSGDHVTAGVRPTLLIEYYEP